MAQDKCEEIKNHMETLLPHGYKVWLMVLYFKVGDNNKLWWLWYPFVTCGYPLLTHLLTSVFALLYSFLADSFLQRSIARRASV